MAYNYPPENLKKWLHFLESEDFLPKARELDGPWKSPQEIEILALHDKIDLFGLGFYVLWVDTEPNRSVKIPASTLRMRKNCWIPTKLILLADLTTFEDVKWRTVLGLRICPIVADEGQIFPVEEEWRRNDESVTFQYSLLSNKSCWIV